MLKRIFVISSLIGVVGLISKYLLTKKPKHNTSTLDIIPNQLILIYNPDNLQINSGHLTYNHKSLNIILNTDNILCAKPETEQKINHQQIQTDIQLPIDQPYPENHISETQQPNILSQESDVSLNNPIIILAQHLTN